MSDTASVPLLGDISLTAVQVIEHSVDNGFVPMRVAGLDGDLQQRTGRRSHVIRIAGVVYGDSATDDLKKLQDAAQKGDELTFSADITKALSLQKVVIVGFNAVEAAGTPNRFDFDITVVESPPLPPPAQIDSFGGLGDFGLGDMGFDSSIMGDLQSAASAVSSAVDAAGGVMGALGALASMAGGSGLSAGNFMAPLSASAGKVGGIGDGFKTATSGLSKAFSS